MNRALAQGATQWLAARSRREQALLGLAAGMLLLALLTALGILPAWRRLDSAAQEQALLDAQWQRMHTLQAQATALRQQARRHSDPASLGRSLVPLGETAQMELSGQQARLQLRGAPSEALAAWLIESRAQTGVVVRQAQLQRVVQEGRGTWTGTLVLDLAP